MRTAQEEKETKKMSYSWQESYTIILIDYFNIVYMYILYNPLVQILQNSKIYICSVKPIHKVSTKLVYTQKQLSLCTKTMQNVRVSVL